MRPPPTALFNAALNATLNDLVNRFPVDHIRCSSYNDPLIDRDETGMLINTTFFDSSAQTMPPTRSRSVWAAANDRLSIQLYICNYHHKWDCPYNVAEYRVVGETLYRQCGF